MTGPHYTYILASKRAGALYVGRAADLAEDVLEHKCHRIDGVTRQYNINQLVYYEAHADAAAATDRERYLKLSHRQWKLDLIEAFNPGWQDLYPLIAPDSDAEAPG